MKSVRAWAPIALALLAGRSPAIAEPPGYFGVVFAHRTADVAPQAAATVREVRVRLGDSVHKGQVLVVLESAELDQAIAGARAAVWAAHADSMRAAADLAQATHLLDRREKSADVFPKEEVEAVAARKASAEAAHESARATIAERFAQLRGLEDRKRSLTLRAPFDGQVAWCVAKTGEFVGSSRPLVRIASTDDLWVRFAVPAAESAWLAAGRVVGLVTESSLTGVRAEVRHVSPEVDSVSGMIIAEAIVLDRAAVGSSLPVGTVVRIQTITP